MKGKGSTLGRAGVPILGTFEMQDFEMRQFDPFPLEQPCARLPRIRRGDVCGGVWGVYNGHGAAHCQRCGEPVPMPTRDFRMGER